MYTLFEFHVFLFAYASTAPAQEAVTYEEPTLLETKLYDNPFVGDPRPELDKAWHDLLESTLLASFSIWRDLRSSDSYFHVSEQTLQRLNRTTIALNDGTYIGGLGVYHELHCLV